jgi:hypothetical protein
MHEPYGDNEVNIDFLINRPSTLEATKNCDFVASLVGGGGGFTLEERSHSDPMEKYTENTMACMLTFVSRVFASNTC